MNVRANKIYFVGYEDDFLTIVDGATNRSTRLKVPGVHQWESAFSERTGMLYLPSPNDNDLIVIDTASDTVSTIGTGQVPMAAAVNEVTNRVYVVNYGSSDVTVIDGAANRPVATIPVGLWPQQIAINARTNTVYVVNTHADSVSVIDGKTNRVKATVPTGRGPMGARRRSGGRPGLCRQPAQRPGDRDRRSHQPRDRAVKPAVPGVDRAGVSDAAPSVR